MKLLELCLPATQVLYAMGAGSFNRGLQGKGPAMLALSEALLAGCRINREFCDLLESGAKPTVAAIQGMALGGGLEVAMACNARISAPGQPPDSTTLGRMPVLWHPDRGSVVNVRHARIFMAVFCSPWHVCDQLGCQKRSKYHFSLGRMLHVARDDFGCALLGVGI